MKCRERILSHVFEKTETEQIWIPDGKIYGYYRRRKPKLQKHLEKELTERYLK